MGVPATIHTVFTDNIQSQQDASDKVYKGNTDQEQRAWRIPNNWGGDPLDIEAFTEPFDREEISEDYQDTFQNEDGREADAIAAKLQGDHVGAQERAFRYRHASHIRCAMHGSNRRKGHAMTDGGVFARVVDHVQDVIVSRNAGD